MARVPQNSPAPPTLPPKPPATPLKPAIPGPPPNQPLPPLPLAPLPPKTPPRQTVMSPTTPLAPGAFPLSAFKEKPILQPLPVRRLDPPDFVDPVTAQLEREMRETSGPVEEVMEPTRSSSRPTKGRTWSKIFLSPKCRLEGSPIYSYAINISWGEM